MQTKAKEIMTAVNKKTVSKFAATALGMVAATHAQAQQIDSSMLGSFGCSIYSFLTGPLAIWAFILVVVGTLVIGLIAKVDFAKIIVVVVVFALIQAIGAYMMSVPSIAAKLGTASCLTQ